MMHERTINGSVSYPKMSLLIAYDLLIQMKQTRPSSTDVEIKEQTSNSRTYSKKGCNFALNRNENAVNEYKLCVTDKGNSSED